MGSPMRCLRSAGWYLPWCLLIVFGVVAIVRAADGLSTGRDELKAQEIVGTPDPPRRPQPRSRRQG